MNYQKILEAALKLGGLTVSELAHWLEVPRPSLQMWLKGTTPHLPTQDKINRKLAQLESAITKSPRPFVPDRYTKRQRRQYLVNQKAKFRRVELGYDE
jgi:hypothetical protein